MASATPKLISALRASASQIAEGNRYEWGHMGGCNCGHLAQNLTSLSRAEIHTYAMSKGTGDWAEQVDEYCQTSGLDMDLLIAELLGNGLERRDLIHLERLSDEAIVTKLAPAHTLRRNSAADASAYMHTWADMLEQQLQAEVVAERELVLA